MFTPKVIGLAIARYDFSSRDTRELSLQEGDVVKIYTKSGANGWWRGEVNGRVSGSHGTPINHTETALVTSVVTGQTWDSSQYESSEKMISLWWMSLCTEFVPTFADI